jgi:hypothetical protein
MANDDKLWTQPALYALAKAAALEAIQSQGGLALPCKVIALNPNGPNGQPLGYSFVQVQFEVNVPYTKPDGTMGTYTLPPLVLPKAEGQWVRSSTQVGDLGVTQAVDTSHGGVSGMSSGVANTGVNYGNLSTLVFVPIANTNFGAPPDPDKVWANGPAGAVVSDTAQTATHVVAVPTLGTPGTITSTIHNPAGTGATVIVQELDGVNNAIKHSLTNASGTFESVVDGVAGAINHIVPTGGVVGLGAAGLGSTRAGAVNADLQTTINSMVQTSLVKMAAQMGITASAAPTGSVAAAMAYLSTTWQAASFITNISGITPTAPTCSTTVFLKS